MRSYATVSPRFWTGHTGRELRKKGTVVQLLALYLITCPSANMIGLYHVPMTTIAAETGLDVEGALEGLRSLSEGGFAVYDEESEHVFIREMASFQIGERLSPKDNRHVGLLRELENWKKERLFKDFVRRYKVPFNLPEYPCMAETGEPLRSPSAPPPKPRTRTGTRTGTGTGSRTGPVATDEFNLAGGETLLPAHKRIAFDFAASKFTGILAADMRAWQEAYPAVAVPVEIDRAALWLAANPAKRKKNYAAFLTRWIASAQEKGGTRV